MKNHVSAEEISVGSSTKPPKRALLAFVKIVQESPSLDIKQKPDFGTYSMREKLYQRLY